MPLAYFLRSRQTGLMLCLLALSGGVGWLMLGQVSDYGFGIIWAIAMVPLLPAMLIGVAIRQPFGETELTASWPLPALRGMHLALLVAVACVVVLATTVGFDQGAIRVELVRNLAGLSGLALIAGRLVGSNLSWIAPLAYIPASTALASTRLDWLERHPFTTLSLGTAIALFVVGVALVLFWPGTPSHED